MKSLTNKKSFMRKPDKRENQDVVTVTEQLKVWEEADS